MRKTSKVITTVTTIILALALASCGGGGGKKDCGCAAGDITCAIACETGGLPGLPPPVTP